MAADQIARRHLPEGIMRTSAPIARWQDSHGVLQQSWSTPAGRLQTRALTQEHPIALRRTPRPNAFALLLAFGYLIPAFASTGSLLAGVVLIVSVLLKEQI